MYFTLTYTGDLKANAGIKDKHKLRKAFHSQLNVLWQQEPLVDHKAFYDKSNKVYDNTRYRAYASCYGF